jgi:hypothetical protein
MEIPKSFTWADLAGQRGHFHLSSDTGPGDDFTVEQLWFRNEKGDNFLIEERRVPPLQRTIHVDLVHIRNHAAELGEITRAAVLVELRRDGQHQISRYPVSGCSDEIGLCSFLMSVFAMRFFDVNRLAPQAPKLAPGVQVLQPPPVPDPVL